MTWLGPSPFVLITPPSPAATTYMSRSMEPEPAPDMMNGVVMGQSDRRASFAQDFQDDAILAVDRLTRDVLLHRVNADEAASLLLPYLIKASYARLNLVFNALMEWATPQDLLFAALSVYERDHDQRVLQATAQLLEHYGSDAAPVLTRLARSDRAECRYFVDTILNMPGVPEEPRRNALEALAKHPDVRTRQELLDETDRAPAREAALVCHLLALDPVEQIRESAREKLAYLES